MSGETALDIARGRNNDEIVQILLEVETTEDENVAK